MALKGKMQAYAEARAQGLRPLDAASHAGYSAAGIRVVTSRLESRIDIQDAIKRYKHRNKKASPEDNGNDLDKWAMRDHYDSPLALLQDVMNNPNAPKSVRYQAAKDALPYCHARKEGGKKDDAAKGAKAVAEGKFGTGRRPSHMGVN